MAHQSKRVEERSLDAPLEDRALGVYWKVEGDELGFKSQQMSKPLTKQGILSMLSSVYDPLGIASPFILGARKVMQELCRAKTGWDDQVSPEHQQQWERWTRGLGEMTELRVPRCLQPFGATVAPLRGCLGGSLRCSKLSEDNGRGRSRSLDPGDGKVTIGPAQEDDDTPPGAASCHSGRTSGRPLA